MYKIALFAYNKMNLPIFDSEFLHYGCAWITIKVIKKTINTQIYKYIPQNQTYGFSIKEAPTSKVQSNISF